MIMIPSKPPLRLNYARKWIHCDESCQTDHRYLILGALSHTRNLASIESDLEAVKRRYYLMREVKWCKTPKKPGKYFDGYKALMQSFSHLELEYKALVVDTRRYPLDHRFFTFGSSELGYYKFFYQLLYSGIIRRNRALNYHVYLDQRPKEIFGSVSTLEQCINSSAFRDEFPEVGRWRCCDIQEADSKMSPCLQLVDLLTGAVGARWNQKVQSQTKLELLDFTEKTLGIDMRAGNSVFGNQKFNLWLFKSTKWEAR